MRRIGKQPRMDTNQHEWGNRVNNEVGEATVEAEYNLYGFSIGVHSWFQFLICNLKFAF